MRKIKTIVFAGIMLTATMAYASGDLIVDGNLGVGTATPGAILHLGTAISGNQKLIQIGEPAFIDTYGLVFRGNSADGIFKLYGLNNSVETDIPLMSWNRANGNVGIGTTNPGAKLDISGASGDEATFNEHIRTTGRAYVTQIGEFIKSANVTSGTTINSTGSINQNIGSGGQNFFSYRWFSGQPTSTDLSSASPLMILTGSGNVGIGTTAPTQKLDVSGTIASNGVALTSDARFKKNLLPIATPLDKVLGLNGHSYEWKTDEYKEKNFPNGRHYGVIAQEIEKVLPEVVNTDAKGEKSVAYTEIIPVLIEAIKEQQKEIEELKRLVRAK
jgi:hypothetical protein